MTATRVLYISEIPTPYRVPLLVRLAERSEIDLEVLYCAGAEPDRPWALGDLGASARVMRGRHLVLRSRRETFVYEFNPEIVARLARRDYDLLVVAGDAGFAEQAALLWARATRVPYVLHSESHLGKARASWRLSLKKLVLPRLVGGAAAGLAAGSAAARYLTAYGLAPERIRIFPNTVDVDALREEAASVRAAGAAERARLGLPERYLLYAGRLVEGKGVLDLLAAHGRLERPAPPLVVVGDGPLLSAVRARPDVVARGFVQPGELAPLYALATAVVVPSHAETWGVTVNEALACGTPVVASDAVGSVEDLLRPGRDGLVFRAGDVSALADALRQVVADPGAFEAGGGPIRRWTYDFGVEQFLEAVQLALDSR